MTMAWLFGEESRTDPSARLQPRVYDIDVVRDVCRMLEAAQQRKLAALKEDAQRREFASAQAAAPQPVSIDELAPPSEFDQSIALVEDQAPMVFLQPSNSMIAAPTPIPLESVQGLNAHDRSRIFVTGAGLRVEFRRNWQPGVVVAVGGARPGEHYEIFTEVVEYLTHSGRRRPQWKRLLPLAPLLLAAGLTALGLWAALSTRMSAAEAAFGAAVVVIAWIGAIVLFPIIGRKYETWSSGHRFREGSLSDVRERLVNARATTIVSIVTIPIGALIGYFLRIWLGE